jgi:hypothetical protein
MGRVNSWQAIPFQMAVNQFFVDRRSPAHQYLLSGGVVFVSTDAGATWKKSDAGLPMELVRGTGRTASKIPAHVSLLVLVDWQKSFLLAATPNNGIFRSIDGGSSWVSIGSGPSATDPIFTAAVGVHRVLLAGAGKLYTSPDGSNWSSLPIRNATISPKSYIGLIEYPAHNGFLVHFRSIQDSGPTMRVAYLDPKGVLIGLNYGVLNHSDIDSVWTSTTNGHTTLFAISANLNFIDQAQQYTRPRFAYASADGGYSWNLLGKPICGERAAPRPSTPSEIWVYGNATCVTRTQDGGATWERLPGVTYRYGSYSNAKDGGFDPSTQDADFRYGNEIMTAVRFDPSDHNIAYYITGGNLYRYGYTPATKQGQAADLKIAAQDLLVDTTNHQALYTDMGKLSTDGGWTWTDKSSSLTTFLGGTPALSNRTQDLISFRGGEISMAVLQYDRLSKAGTIRIIKSHDAGGSWEQISSLNTRASCCGGWEPKLFVNETDALNFLLATSAASGPQLFETKDGGRTWKNLLQHGLSHEGKRDDPEAIHTFGQVTEGGGRSLLIGGRYGLWKSTDEGDTWKRLGGVQ